MVETWSTLTAGGSCGCRERFGCGLDDQALVDQGHASDGRYAVAYINALVAQLPERRGEHHHEIRDSVFSACESKSREWITCCAMHWYSVSKRTERRARDRHRPRHGPSILRARPPPPQARLMFAGGAEFGCTRAASAFS